MPERRPWAASRIDAEFTPRGLPWARTTACRRSAPRTQENSMRTNRKLMAMLLLAMMGTLAACHTVEGVGKDVESAGDSIQDTAHDCTDNVQGNC
jgi:predicted small secreted protein